MILHLDRAQMLEQWRLHRAYLPKSSLTAVTRFDTIDTDAILEAEMDAWYRRQLLEAPPELLCPADLSGQVVFIGEKAADGSTPVSLPSSVVRVLDVRLRSWLRPAVPVTDPSDALVSLQLHPYTRATPSLPVALLCGSELRLYPGASDSDMLLSLRCVVLTEGLYEFDSSLLSSLRQL